MVLNGEGADVMHVWLAMYEKVRRRCGVVGRSENLIREVAWF
jgi:hypothetical protein